MSNDQLETLLAAVCVKLKLPCNVNALVRGLPQRHAVEFSLGQSADFILGLWQSGESETRILDRDAVAGAKDKLRDDYP